MPEDIQQTSNELNDASADRAINTERDLSTTNLSQDVDTQELIRSNNQYRQAAQQSEDLLDRRQERRHAEEMHHLRMTQQINAESRSHVHAMELNKQAVRHVDHTTIDLHNPKKQDAAELGTNVGQ